MVHTIVDYKYKHLIWKDKLGGTFLLTKYCEVFKYDESVLGIYSWSKRLDNFLEKHEKMIIRDKDYFADGFNLWHVKREFLDDILNFPPVFKKRPDTNGKWIQNKKELLARDIIKYRLCKK